jgi:hypothetical protein
VWPVDDGHFGAPSKSVPMKNGQHILVHVPCCQTFCITKFDKFCFAIPAQNLKIKPGGESMKRILLDNTISETCHVNK